MQVGFRNTALAHLDPGEDIQWPALRVAGVYLVGAAIAGVDPHVGCVAGAELNSHAAVKTLPTPAPADFAPVDRSAGPVGEFGIDGRLVVEEFEQLAVAAHARDGRADIDDFGSERGVGGKAHPVEPDFGGLLVLGIGIERGDVEAPHQHRWVEAKVLDHRLRLAADDGH